MMTTGGGEHESSLYGSGDDERGDDKRGDDGSGDGNASDDDVG